MVTQLSPGAPDNVLVVAPADGSEVSQLVMALLADGHQAIGHHVAGILAAAGKDDSDVEHVHKARVATRRLRSDLRTFGAVVDASWREDLRDELRWLGGALGTVRDADVLASWLRSERATLDDRDRGVLDDILLDLGKERATGHRQLVALLGSQRYRRLMEQLASGARRLPVPGDDVGSGGPAHKSLPKLVRAEWDKLESLAHRLGKNASDQDLHRLRIRAKRVRYAAEAAVPKVGKPARLLAEAVTELQQVLGDLHDTLETERWLRHAGTTGGAAYALVAGQLLERTRQHRERCRREWPGVWKTVSDKKLRRWLKT
jgi:CHAD domain-containing protein